MQWAELHSELKNKIRWSIASSTQHADFNLGYQSSVQWATLLATEIVEELKLVEEKPNYTPWKGEKRNSLRLVANE